MAKSVQDLPKEIHQYIDIYEWDMRTQKGYERFRELKAKSLPSIALDEDLMYESLIPGQEDLTAEIIRRWTLKNKKETAID